MNKLTFKGGIYPRDNKQNTNQKPIAELPDCGEYTFPLSGGYEAAVSIGDKVKMGQIIAVGEGQAIIHSSVSGKVAAVENRLAQPGVPAPCIVIENDYLDTLDPKVKPNGTIDSVAPEEIVKIVNNAGIAGMGGAEFPTHIKLNPPPAAAIDTVIINGAECESYLTGDHRVMLESPEAVVTGLRLAMKAVGAVSGIVAIEDNKKDAVSVMAESVGEYDNIKVAALKTKYPQGSEKQIIKSAVNREVEPGKLPSSACVLVLNAATAAAIARAVYDGMPLIKRVVTVSGNAIAQPQNFEVRIGTPVSFLIEQAGGFKNEPRKIIAGGPMMGVTLSSVDVPVTKGTTAVLAFDQAGAKSFAESECARCGRCINVCPMGLAPLYLNKYVRLNDMDNLKSAGIADCMECGACSYICPCKRQLVQSFRLGKDIVKEK